MVETKELTDLGNEEARTFLLHPSSYCNFSMPPYINLKGFLQAGQEWITETPVFDSSYYSSLTPKQKKKFYQTIGRCPDLNYLIRMNKDGRYAWRPLTLVHPYAYATLVIELTEHNNWEKLKTRFNTLYSETQNHVIVASKPRVALSKDSDSEDLLYKTSTKENISNWWDHFEQETVRQSIIYPFLAGTDIANFYSSIYTHSIAWAIEGRDNAKANHSLILLGNRIDALFQALNAGETIGIPQGNACSDIIAEIILANIDSQVIQAANNEKGIKDFKILRYRDDYRIMTKTRADAEIILQLLVDILAVYNLSLNSQKTWLSDDVISSAVKPEKLDFRRSFLIGRPVRAMSSDNARTVGEAIDKAITENSVLQETYYFQESLENITQSPDFLPQISEILSKSITETNLRDFLFYIREFAKSFPNSGSLQIALELYKKTIKSKPTLVKDVRLHIAIILDIVSSNPRCLVNGIAIFSLFLEKMPTELKSETVQQILDYFQTIPNVEYVRIWLQRIALGLHLNTSWDSKLCALVESPTNGPLWGTSFLSTDDINSESDKFTKIPLVDECVVQELSDIMSDHEYSPFSKYGS